MTPNNRRAALAAVVLALALIPRAEATLMKAATFDEKVSNAAAVIVGHVVKSESKWDDQHRWILTYTTFRIDKAIKGVPGQQELTVVAPGGTIGDVHQDTEGVPEFIVGNDHVLFVRNSELGPTVLFFDQGAYDVDKSTKMVKPVASDAVSVDTQRGVAVGSEEPRSLESFERAVRDSGRRQAMNRMAMIQRQQKLEEEQSVGAMVGEFKWFIVLALAGIALATWHFYRR